MNKNLVITILITIFILVLLNKYKNNNSEHFANEQTNVMLWDNKKIVTKDIDIVFKEGKPFLIKSILLFKNSSDWFNFLNFMSLYSKETGLFFGE